ncbi:MAG: galactokinase [Spirochaetes bacterium]|nr:galactokinase [Spirochaetota bacterium]
MKDLVSVHSEEYGNPPNIIVKAPGVVTLLGEHTESTGGFALPFAMDRTISMAISTRKDSSLRFYALDLGERKRTSLINLKFKKEDRWANYLKGVIQAFLESGFSGIKGLNVTISGDIPSGIGLGASTAMATAMAVGLQHLFHFSVTDRRLIDFIHYAESTFLEKKGGYVQIVASLLGKENHGIILDTKFLEWRYVPIPMEAVKFLITNSQVPRSVVEEELSQRWEDCEKCLELLQRKKPGATLRDFSPRDIRESMGLIPESIRRRCLHIVEENYRVKEAEEILRRNGNLLGLSKLLNRSHESLRDLFEVSCPEIDWLVKRSLETEGVLGSKLIGSGFGGCIITLLYEHALEEFKKHLEEYERIFGFKAVSFLCTPSTGAQIL